MALSSNFNIQLSAIVDTSKLIKNIQSSLDKHEFKININAGTSTSGIGSSVSGIAGSDNKTKTSEAQINKVSMAVENFTTKLKNMHTEGKISTEQFNEFSQSLESINQQFSTDKNITKFSKSMNTLRNSVSETSVAYQQNVKDTQKHNLELAQAQRQLNSVTRQYETYSQQLKNMHTEGKITTQQFDEFNVQLNAIYDQYQQTGKEGFGDFTKQLYQLKNNVSGAKSEIAAMGQKLTDIILKFTKWYLIAGVVTSIIGKIKEIPAQVKAIDDALVELNKVSNLTENQMDDVTQAAFKMGTQVGKTATAVIGAITEFKRAGYTLQESMQLAETALIMTNVAEGITDAGDAANYLISILKGANLEISYANKLLDELNEISNTSAINFDSLANMTQRISGTMTTLGNSIEETMALITGAYEVLQDERVAKGLSVIGLRISGLNEDLEREAGLQSNVNKALMEYAGISIFDSTRQLRDTYDILEDLAGVWGGLNKNVQTFLTTTLAGKNRADVLSAVLQNWEGVENAMASAMDSSGSALQEQEAYLNSIQGKQEALANAWQELADATLDSGVIKFLVDVSTLLTKILTATGGLGNTVSFLVGLLIVINAQKWAEKLTNIGKGIKSTISSIKNLTTAIRTSTVAANGLQAALGGIGIAAMALTAIIGIVKGFIALDQHLKEAEEERRQAAIASADETISKLTEVKSRYEELANNTNRTADEEEELLKIQKSLVQNYGYLKKGIDEVNGSYKDFIEVIDKAAIEQMKVQRNLLEADVVAAKETLSRSKQSGGFTNVERRNRLNEFFGTSYNFWNYASGGKSTISDFGFNADSLSPAEIAARLQQEVKRLELKRETATLTTDEAVALSRYTSYLEYYNNVIDTANDKLQEYDDLNEKIKKGTLELEESQSEYNEALEQLKANINSTINALEDKIALDKAEREELEKQEKMQQKLLKVEQARLALAEAKNKQVRVFRAGQGFVYEADQSEVQKAQETLTSALEDLAEYKYEIALENAENFVAELSKLLMTGDIVTGLGDMLNKYGDLLGDSFNEYLEMAKKYAEEFNQVVTTGQLGSPITYQKVPAYASGTSYASGGLSLVGEQGPELVNLPTGARVYTSSQTSRMLGNLSGSGGLGGTSFNVGTVVINEPNNFEGFVNEFCSQLNVPKPVKFSS